MNELDNAKRAWDKAQSSLSDAMLKITPFQGDVRHPLRQTEAWQNLYYGQPNSANAEKSLGRKLSALQAQDGVAAAAVAPFVAAAIEAAQLVCSLRNAPKVPRSSAALQSKYGTGYRGGWAPQSVAPEAINPGDYLIVTYGNGHQLVYVNSISGEKGLNILRLSCRGYTYASWQSSWISRFDNRIHGLGRPHPADPRLPGFPGPVTL